MYILLLVITIFIEFIIFKYYLIKIPLTNQWILKTMSINNLFEHVYVNLTQ